VPNCEIERKFLVSQPWRAIISDYMPWPPRNIEQCYLGDTGAWAIRARKVFRHEQGITEHILTMKRHLTGFTAVEIEQNVEPRFYDQIAEMCGHEPLTKLRFDCARWELDVFQGRLEGLVIAEIELASEDEAFDRPVWLGEEVTSDRRYSNYALSRRLIK
jgi:adenylate cyclase